MNLCEVCFDESIRQTMSNGHLGDELVFVSNLDRRACRGVVAEGVQSRRQRQQRIPPLRVPLASLLFNYLQGKTIAKKCVT